MEKKIKRWKSCSVGIRMAISLIWVILSVVLIELCFNLKLITLPDSEKGTFQINDYTETANGIIIDYDGYVNKLIIDYNRNGELTQNITVDTGEQSVITRKIPLYLDRTVNNINKTVNSLEVTTQGRSDIVSVSVKNEPYINWMRVWAVLAFLAAIDALVIFRTVIARKAELGFAIIAAGVGIGMIIAMPLSRVGFDEESHFRSVFILSFEGQTTEDGTLWDMLNVSDANHPAIYTGSYEEYNDLYDYLNEHANYYNIEDEEYRITPRSTSSFATFGYVFMSFGVNVARMCHMGFANIYILARIINLITYIVLMTFAIRILKKGKMVLAVLALMPTNMFLASTITYDVAVTGFISLGLAFIINGFTETEKPVSWKQLILGLAFMGYGCLPKAVYAPLLLLPLFYSADRFKDSKTKLLMKLISAAGFVIAVSTAALPMLINGSGDPRGGNTDGGSQISFILNNMGTYAGLLCSSIINHLQQYTIGPLTLDNMYFLGIGRMTYILDVVLAYVIITHNHEGYTLRKNARIGLGVTIAASTALVWTIMYVVFTEVGITSVINGVQGRYFIPLLFAGSLLFTNKHFKNNIRPEVYNFSLYIAMGLILGYESFYQLLNVSCF